MSWLVSYFSTILGILLVQLVGGVFMLPILAAALVGFVIFGDDGGAVFVGFAAVAYAPIWLWYLARFFFPVGLQIIIAGLRGLFAIEYVTPGRVIGMVSEGVAVLRSDVDTLRRAA